MNTLKPPTVDQVRRNSHRTESKPLEKSHLLRLLLPLPRLSSPGVLSIFPNTQAKPEKSLLNSRNESFFLFTAITIPANYY